MQKFKNAGLGAVATAALAIGIIGAPQAAMAETCALVTNTGQPNNFVFPGSDNGYNPITNSGVPATPSNIACGQNSTVTGTDATAFGANTIAGQSSTAIGANASATGTGSVALGQGSSDGGVANVVSVGAAGSERRVINVAAGTNATDAVNLGQLNVVASNANTALTNSATALTAATSAQTAATTANTNATTALTAATTAQTTASTALANAATAQASANAANASIATVQTMVTSQAATITSIQALNATQSSQISVLTAGQTALSNQIIANNEAANGGIAAAMAMGGTVMPSDANFALSFNVSTYRGEQGFSGTAVARVSEKVYFSAGVAGSTAKGSTGGRAGVTFAW